MELTLQAALLALLTISLSGSAAAQASVSVRNSCDSAANSVAIDFTVAFFVEAAGEYFTACSAYGKPENGTFLCILTTRVPPGAAQVLGQTVSAVWSAAASVSGQPGCLRHLQGSKKTGGRYKKVTATGLKDCTAGQPDCLFFEEVKAGRQASVPRQLCTTPCASPPSTRWPPPQADSPAGSPVAGPAPPGDALRQLERQALLNFKSGLAKASSLSSWNPDSDPCGGWLGVACDAANTSVVSLTLAGLQLIGVISESLAQLPALFIVDLSRNGLAGPIPYAWQNGTGNAASIRNLRLHDNLFSGPLPPLALPSLIAATLHNNLFTGSIPASWARLPASAGISILPQLGPGLCGSLPTYPSLNMAIGNSTKYYNITNSLGSCLEAPCSLPPASLDGSNVFRVAASHKVTAWDVAALNGWTEQPTDASSVEMPCYRSGSPVGGYLGGNQAFQMAAWGDGLLAAGFAAIEPGRKAPCSVIAMRWTVDLRYNLSLAQVVVQAGALGMRGVIVRVGDDPSGVDGTVCADELRAQSFATTAVCLAAGRYLTLVSAQPMHLCSVAAYPAVADAALNQPTFSTRVGRAVVEARNVARDEPFVIQAPPGTSPTYVVDLGQTSLVAAVSIHKAANVQTVSVAASNPLAGNATRRRARSLLQAATTQDCRIDYTSASATPFYCEAAGRYVVVRGTTNTGMELQHPMVFLRMLGAAQPPSMKLLWIGDLLIGGIVAYLPDEGLRQTLLVAYNAAWSRALAEAGHLMNTTASVIISLQKNVTNPAGPPYYYESNFAGSATFTNTTVSVDASLTPDRLREVLGTPAVALDIAKNLSLYGLKRMWMVPYTSEPNSTAVSLNSTNNTENNSGDVGTTSSLGSAAIAGIAVAAAVVAAVGIAGALCVRRRRRRHIEANPAWSRLSSKLLQSASATAGTTDLLLSVLQSKFSNVQLISDSSRRPSGGMAETWRMSANELRVSRPVGRGSYGAVYRGSWQGHVVAIKILVACHVEDIKTTEQAQAALTLPVPTLAKLRAEADMLASLRHPSVVSFYGLIEDPPCIVTEYCARGSLDSVLREGRLKVETARQLTWRRRIQMALEAATGMRYLHSRTPPVVHRDLKGPNLLVTEDWHVKVGDFNLSRAMVEDAPTGSTTTNLNPRWLAPEVMRGQPASLAADVFSFGCCMWELTTWHIPWRNESAWQIVGNVMNGERLAVPPVASLPGGGFSGLDDWLALMHACWAHDPPERPSFEEVTSALRRLLKHTEAPTQGQVE